MEVSNENKESINKTNTNIKNKSKSKNKNKKKKNNNQFNNNTKKKNKSKKIDGLLELRRLLKEENIVTGYAEDCVHEAFKRKVSFYPCPWDSRVLNDSHKDVDCGCYYHCRKNNTKILENKDIYLEAIDTLISNLEQNEKWGMDGSKHKGILNENSKKQLDIWQKRKDEEDRIRFEQEEKNREENEVTMISCPPEFMQDLIRLHKLGLLENLDEDEYKFMDDKIVYTYFDCYDFSENEVEITTDSIYFIMCPNQERTILEINIGTGMLERIDIELTDKNRKELLGFWEKWHKFKKSNPELYNNHSYSFENITEDDIKKALEILECETCLFTNHCDRVFCLKG